VQFQGGAGRLSCQWRTDNAGVDGSCGEFAGDRAGNILSERCRGAESRRLFAGCRRGNEKNAAFWGEYGVDDTATVKRITDLILEEPGNYLKYYVGYLKFRQMREQLALENKSFSVSAFHEAILRTGPSPFSVLEETVRDQLK